MAILVEDGKIKVQEGYAKKRNRRSFWQLSYDCYGPEYVNGNDGEGVAIIRQHEREDNLDYKRRLEVAVPLSIVGPILRRYNSFVFRKDINVDSESFGDFWEDVDGRGTSVKDFMSRRTLKAQIQESSFIYVDGTSDGSEKSIEQAQKDGDRIVWKPVSADEVIQVRWYADQVVEAAFIQIDSKGVQFVLWVDDINIQRYDVEIENDAAGMHVKIIAEYPMQAHGHSGCPLVGLRPDFGNGVSQAAAIAELQKSIARYRSLLDEEIHDATFTQKYVIGESAENVAVDTKYGSKHAIFIPNPVARIESMGGDPAQATSIRQSITDDKEEAYRVAGIAADTADTGPAESGVARAFKFNDLAAILKALAQAAQAAQRRAETLTADALGLSDWKSCKYDDEFTMPIFENELRQCIDVVVSQLPGIIKKNLINRFVERNIELDDADIDELNQQIDDLGVLSRPLT